MPSLIQGVKDFGLLVGTFGLLEDIERLPTSAGTEASGVDAALHDGEEYMGMPAAYPYSAYVSPFPYPPPFSRQAAANYDEQSSTLRGGTLLHKGFYDLLSLIPSTPSPSRLFWRGAQNEEPVAGPRYEEIPPDNVSVA